MAVDRFDLSRGDGGDTVHEDYSDRMFMIGRKETPFLDGLRRTKARNTEVSWNIERLNDPMFNAHADGAAFDLNTYHATGASATPNQSGSEGGQNAVMRTWTGAATNVTPTPGNPYTAGTGVPAYDGTIDGNLGRAPGYSIPERVGVYLQISRKEIGVTRRSELVNTAARRSEWGRLRARRALELRRDMEMIALSNQPTRPGTSSDPNTYDPDAASWTAGAVAWIGSSRAGPQAGTARYNTFSEATANPSDDPVLDGGGGVFGKPTTAVDETSPGAPTLGALQESNLLNVHAAVAEEGGVEGAILLLVPFRLKQRLSQHLLSTSTRIASITSEQGKTGGAMTARGSVSYYETDHGLIEMKSSKFMRNTDVLFLNKDMWEIAILDGLKKEKIGKNKDATEEMWTIDWGLKCLHEGANGIIRDINSGLDVTS